MNANFNQGPIQSEAQSGLNRYMVGVYNKMFAALCLTGIVSYVCSTNERILSLLTGGFSILLMLATLGIVIYLTARINKISTENAHLLFWVYSALIGMTMAPIFIIYTGTSIANTFFTTAIFFGGMSLYGYVTKRDLTALGSFMFVGLISVVIATVINLFIQSSALQMGLSALTIVIFCGLTAYDVQKIRTIYATHANAENVEKYTILASLSLYLDFINMFIALLRFLGDRK
ncbi:MAG: Bax inhibitor-1/YccA family protein [Alphaproteobacteria bacterium]|nr:Bax inhibitor-1/YccA family protein [Alphaproteobacteria bacterium]